MFAVVAATAFACGTLSMASDVAAPERTGWDQVGPGAPHLARTSAGVVDPDLEALWRRGRSLEAFIAQAERRKDLWATNREVARIPQDVAERMTALNGHGPWRLLVVAADGCLDSAHNIPPMDRLARWSDELELRIVTPAEGGQAVMNARRTSDGRAATPTVVILDEQGEEVGCWIERPSPQRDFYLARLKGVEEGSEARAAAVQEFLGWYRRDNGATALRELVTLLAAAAGSTGACAASMR